MSNLEQQYRPLKVGEIIQPGDEWEGSNGDWNPIRGAGCVGEPYQPEPHGKRTYHARHRRPILAVTEMPAPSLVDQAKAMGERVRTGGLQSINWESLYKEEVAAKDEWKSKYQKHLESSHAFELASARHAEKLTKEKALLESEVRLCTTSLYEQEKRHKEEVAKLNARIEELQDIGPSSSFSAAIKAALDAAGAPTLHPDIGAPARKPMMPQERIKALSACYSHAIREIQQAGSEREQSLSAQVAKLNANYIQVMTERDQLARWKEEAMTVLDQWKRVDDFVRSHPSFTLADTVAHKALEMLHEGYGLKRSIGVVESWMPKPPTNLREDIIRAINCRSAENGSDTPDWILGDFLMASLAAFDEATNARTRYNAIPDDAPETDPPTTTAG